MKYKRFSCAALILCLAGCAGYTPPVLDQSVYKSTYSGYDLDFYWKTARSPGKINIDGFVRNNTYYYLRDLELTLTILSASGQPIAEKTHFIVPRQVRLDETLPFTVTLAIPEGQDASRVRVLYRYQRIDDTNYALPYFHTFEREL